MKRIFTTFALLIFLFGLVIAQSSNYKLEISTTKDIFEAGENITLKVTVFDENNKPIKDNVLITLEDAEKNIRVGTTIISNEFVEVDISEEASHGQGKITAKYQNSTTTGFFVIGIEELAKFEIEGEYLTVTNIGNTKYSKTIQITIGDTTGIKEPKLSIGESVRYRLIAPDGTYQIKVTDGKTTISQGDVQLTGTGRVIGALDERADSASGITGISPDEDSEGDLLNQLKRGSFIYIFVLVVFGATILLAIERRYRKKLWGLD